MNPIINNNVNINALDTEMSDGANQSSSASNGLTPASSNTYNSNSSSTYSPPYAEDESTGATRIQSNTQKSYSMNMPGDRTFLPGIQILDTNSAKSPGNTSATNTQDDLFQMPAEWDVDPAGTPGFSGMTPDGNWDKLMQDGGWEKMMQDGTWIDQSQRTGMTPR